VICRRCGLVHPEQANYCMHCGAGLRNEPTQSVWRRLVYLLIAVVAVLVLFFTAFPQPAPGPNRVPAAAAMTELPILVCASDPDWVRPTPAEMSATIWEDKRYQAADGGPHLGAQAHYAGHVFVVSQISASGLSHLVDMAGLRTAPSLIAGACGSDPELREALGTGQQVELWLIGYEVSTAQIAGSADLAVTVTPHEALDRGYQILRVARPDPTQLALRVALPDGEVVAAVTGRQFYGPIDVPGWPPAGS
jgi:hypothetical protein